MKICRLSLQNWRGIVDREIHFDAGVTLIEGANEIGKSTLVEALRMLFRDQDSSRKKEVKAIQPAGRDVGSSVEADIECGDVHFTYGKTYNRRPRTELRIRSPRPAQLTGGEAHNQARAILEEHMDVELWETLLIEQGHALGAIRLADSNGLARALDAASGGQGSDGDGSVILEAARAEYERYFTPGRGREKFSSQIEECERLRDDVNRLEESLKSLDEDLLLLQRLEHEMEQRRLGLPDLTHAEEALTRHWGLIEELQHELARAREAQAPLEELLQNARDRLQTRQHQLAETAGVNLRIEELASKLEPLAAQLASERQTLAELSSSLDGLRERRREQQSRERRAQRDLQHLEDVGRLADVEDRLQRLETLDLRIETLREKRDLIAIDEAGRAAIEAAQHALVLARAVLDRTATRLEIAARHELHYALDGDARVLSAGEAVQRLLTRPLEIELPDGVLITLTPGSGDNDPQSQLADAEAALQTQLERYGVRDPAEAMTAYATRQALQEELAQLESVARRQLTDESGSRDALVSQARQLRQSTTAYLEERNESEPLPAERLAAARRLEQTRADAVGVDAETERLERLVEQQRREWESLYAAHQHESQALLTARARRDQLATTLERERERESDKTLEVSLAQHEARLAESEARLASLQQRLAQEDPETTGELLENARQARQRAQAELTEVQQQHAIVESRLQRAQASGQQELLAQATQRLAGAERQLESTQRRAAAARHLWERLNHFRDATQKAYVKPLQAQIERLGRLVFGSDFSLTLGEDWSITECSRGGITLAFHDLSVGAQEQLGILTRLAAAQIVAEHGGVPVIIDDALGFSDPERLRGMGAAIAAAGRDAQVILLSCTPDRFRHVGSVSVVRL